MSNAKTSMFISNLALLLYSIFLTLLIGLRFEVGVDWDNYLVHLDAAMGVSFFDAIQGKDSAYSALNWLANEFGFGVWFVNLVCAILFVSGLVNFCKNLPKPWLALAIAAPYISIVFAMNYTRQAAAFGLLLFALVALQRSRLLSFLLFIIVAGMFHKSAVLLIPLGLLIGSKNRIFLLFVIVFFAVVSFFIFLLETQNALIEQYISGEMGSDGAWVRVLMNALPSAVFLAMLKHFTLNPNQRRIYVALSVFSLLFIPLLMVSPSSTAVDRIALFLLPIQLYIFSHLPISVRPWRVSNIATLGILCIYASAMLVWFEFSPWSIYWLPYRFYPLEAL
ncbi:MAG: EpsG family protein [bacterium]|nr:EpsG family protein [bacterium]